MTRDSSWRFVFLGKGVWNCLFTLFLLFGDGMLREWLRMPSADPVYRELFLAMAFVFGIGYWWVGRDVTQNHAIVHLVIYGQLSVFVIAVIHSVRGELPLLYALPALVDLVFAVLFGLFLRQTWLSSQRHDW
jgi:hypothetical protein